MTMATCKECSNPLPSKALICPHCGRQSDTFYQWQQRVFLGVGIVIVGFFVLLKLGLL